MPSEVTGILDEAYGRLHATGPEFEGWLSNHGPMVAEAMAHRGHAGTVHRWLDGYVRRLEEFPRGTGPIGPGWRDALGDPRRIADWTGYFRRELAMRPWRHVLGTWWPRLLPGVAAAATHGVIRTGHAVRALLTDGDDPAHVTELAHGLAYWAARWQPVPGAQERRRPAPGPRSAGLTPAAALAAVPRIAGQSGGIRERLPRLARLAGWPAVLSAAPIPESAQEIRAWLAGLADAAAIRYLEYGHGNPIMLVHSATAPTAILRTLPALSEDLWAPSAAVGAVAECTSMIGLPCPYSRYRMAAASASPASHALISWADSGIGAADSTAGQPASRASRGRRSRIPPDWSAIRGTAARAAAGVSPADRGPGAGRRRS